MVSGDSSLRSIMIEWVLIAIFAELTFFGVWFSYLKNQKVSLIPMPHNQLRTCKRLLHIALLVTTPHKCHTVRLVQGPVAYSR